MNKKSQLSDAIANLYRAALYLAKEDYEAQMGVKFAEKAIKYFEKENKFGEQKKALKKALNKYSISDRKQTNILAEKILDQYLYLK